DGFGAAFAAWKVRSRIVKSSQASILRHLEIRQNTFHAAMAINRPTLKEKMLLYLTLHFNSKSQECCRRQQLHSCFLITTSEFIHFAQFLVNLTCVFFVNNGEN